MHCRLASRLPSLLASLLLVAGLLPGTEVRAWQAASLRESNVAVPMRDGRFLSAHILRPGTGARVPVLVYRTPYGKDAALADYGIFQKAVARGYAVVVQDVRGRYASEGEFRAYENEGRDGYDTIEWAARQPWSDGAVGTFGLSYPGAVQWLAAVESPPHLKAMVPAMTFIWTPPDGQGLFACDERQVRLQVYIRPVFADRSLRALMDSADPHLISPQSSKLGRSFRLGGSRSDLFAITRCSPCATF